MRNLPILFFALLLWQSAFSQVMWQVKESESKKWFLQFHDEFDGEALDESKWKSGLPWGNAQYFSDSYFTPDNVLVNEHTLTLRATNEPYHLKLTPWEIDSVWFKEQNKPIPDEYVFKYRTGKISSKRKFKNGYFEIRFKTEKVQGMWPSFWLYGGEPNEEIDFFEIKSKHDKQLHVDMHCPDGCDNYRGGFLNLTKGWGGWISLTKGMSEGWNIVSGEWEKDHVKLFFNGTPIAFFKGGFKTWQYLMIGNGTERIGRPPAGPDQSTQWPNTLQVDYVRVWSAEDTVAGSNNTYRVFNDSPQTISGNELYSGEVKKKRSAIYDKNVLSKEKGTITLLPVSYTNYSLSIAGKNLGKIQAEVLDTTGRRVADFTIENSNYYLMDLSLLQSGSYTIKINVLNQVLTEDISIPLPAKAEQRN